jgi:N-acetylglucosaminyldiphosphoundecaprenol N-acetyl-beta-D-mannosaminyltransferase
MSSKSFSVRSNIGSVFSSSHESQLIQAPTERSSVVQNSSPKIESKIEPQVDEVNTAVPTPSTQISASLPPSSNPPSSSLPNVTTYLLGRRITCMTVPAIVSAIDQACQNQRQLTIANYNVHCFNLSVHLRWFNDFLQNADIAHCDGRGILEALRFIGYNNLSREYRASYTELMPSLLEHCNTNGYGVFLLGGKPKTLEMAIANIRAPYPNIHVDGHHGYFSFKNFRENQEVVAQINRSQSNVLIVGMGLPLQERWIQLYQQHLNVNAILPGGAVIDRLAGIVPDCPRLLSNSGLEWLFRLVREPRRLFVRYLLGIPAFGLQVALAKYLNLHSESEQLKEIAPAHGNYGYSNPGSAGQSSGNPSGWLEYGERFAPRRIANAGIRD